MKYIENNTTPRLRNKIARSFNGPESTSYSNGLIGSWILLGVFTNKWIKPHKDGSTNFALINLWLVENALEDKREGLSHDDDF